MAAAESFTEFTPVAWHSVRDGISDAKQMVAYPERFRMNLPISGHVHVLPVLTVRVGFHYPSSRAELTARELGCIF